MNIRNLLLLIALFVTGTANAQITRVQVINNCPDLSIQAVDVYINGQLVVDDIFFRTASVFQDVQSGNQLRINVTDNTAMDTNSAFYSTNVTLNPNNKYIIVIKGMKSTTGYSPLEPLGLHVTSIAAENAVQGSNTDVLFYNGSTDGPTFSPRSGTTTMGNQLSFGQFGPAYYPVAGSGNINIRFTNGRGNQTTHNFEGDFSNFSLTGSASLLLTSGFVNTAANSNGDPFGLFASSPFGGPLQELTPTATKEKLARVQFIHNSADTGVGKVDVFLNSNKIIDTLNYHVASPYLDLFAGTNIPLTVAHPGQPAFLNSNLNLDSGKTYIVMLHGIKSDTNYKPRPAFKATVFSNAKEEAANATSTDVLVMHGSTDAPIIDINSSSTLVTDLAYGSFGSGYTSFPSAGGSTYHVDTGTSNTPQGSYNVSYNLWNATGITATVVTSGFVEPDSNSKGQAFGLWAATADGGPMSVIPIMGSVAEFANKKASVKVWPNPANDLLSFEKKANKVNVAVVDILGRVLIKEQDYSKSTINISKLANGNYYLLVSSQGDLAVAKFTKQ